MIKREEEEGEDHKQLIHHLNQKNSFGLKFFAKGFGIIVLVSVVLTIIFVVYSLSSTAPDRLQIAIGINGTFSKYISLSNLTNKPLYGTILAFIIFSYFLVLLVLWFSCFFGLYMTTRKSVTIRSWCIINVSYLCCSVLCLKNLGLTSSKKGSSKILRPYEYSDENNGLNYGSVQGAGGWEASNSMNGKIQKEDSEFNPTIRGLPSDEYNPFDRDSFKRREKYQTFHGWGYQKRGETTGQLDPTVPVSKGDEDIPKIPPAGVQPHPRSRNQSISSTTSTDDPQNFPAKINNKSRTTSISQADQNTSLPILPPAGGASRKEFSILSQQQQPQPLTSQALDSGSRSMDVFPREILMNPEYRSLFDTAARHIRLISHQKKKEENRGTDIPVVASLSPSAVRNTRDSDFESIDDDFEYDTTYSPTGSEKEFLKNSNREY